MTKSEDVWTKSFFNTSNNRGKKLFDKVQMTPDGFKEFASKPQDGGCPYVFGERVNPLIIEQ
jgi:hypothetical protein